MKISGTQIEIGKIFNLLDKEFILPWICQCNIGNPGSNTHFMSCRKRDNDYQQYEIEYDGYKIIKCKQISNNVGGDNLLSGNIK